MNSSRRLFLAHATVAAGAVALQKKFVSTTLSGKLDNTVQGDGNAVTVYHTNGIKGSVGPVYKTAGGLRQINAQLQNEGTNNLLLDAGNFLNMRMNFEQQRQLVALMNNSGYKAAAISGMDLSDGGEKLTTLAADMKFPLVNCNHRFTPDIKKIIKPYLTFKSGDLKIGVTGVCAPLKGVAYNDAIECANRTACFLKETERCHLVICLSDLGPVRKENELSDQALAKSSEHIDMIVGNDHGKLHNNDAVWHNKQKREVIFVAAVNKGLTIGKSVISFNDEKLKQGVTIGHIIPGKPAAQKYGAALRELSLAGDPSLV
jgi:5'-nucleotidase